MESFWVYKNISFREKDNLYRPIRKEVAGFQIDGESKIVPVRQENGEKTITYSWYRINPGGEIIYFSVSIGPDLKSSLMDFDPPAVILPKSLAPGTSWEVKFPNNENKLYTAAVHRIESDTVTVTVPAGTFLNCLKVKHTMFNETGKETGTAFVYYARGIGEVLTEMTEPPEQRYRSELAEYEIKE